MPILGHEVTVNPKFGRRTWVKLWVNEWLDGTTRFEMSDAQRAFWIDLLAMAGRSRFPGIVCAGKTPEGKFIGYPVNKYQSLMSEPINVEETLELFTRTGKIRVEVTSEGPIRLLSIELLNWTKYQSEYQRQKPYREAVRLQQSDSQSDTQSNKTEVETETEVDREEETPSTLAHAKDMAFETFKVKFGSAPAWDTSDYTALAKLFKRIPTLSFEEFNRRWANFLYSEDVFEVNQGGRLRYFCANFDRFMQEKKSGEPTKTKQRTRTNAQVITRVCGPMDSGAGRALPSGTQRTPSPALPKGTRGHE